MKRRFGGPDHRRIGLSWHGLDDIIAGNVEIVPPIVEMGIELGEEFIDECDQNALLLEGRKQFDDLGATPRTPNYPLQPKVVQGLAVCADGDAVGEHCEVVRNDRVVPLPGPALPSPPSLRLSRQDLFKLFHQRRPFLRTQAIEILLPPPYGRQIGGRLQADC